MAATVSEGFACGEAAKPGWGERSFLQKTNANWGILDTIQWRSEIIGKTI
jgi:hypothetical protein